MPCVPAGMLYDSQACCEVATTQSKWRHASAASAAQTRRAQHHPVLSLHSFLPHFIPIVHSVCKLLQGVWWSQRWVDARVPSPASFSSAFDGDAAVQPDRDAWPGRGAKALRRRRRAVLAATRACAAAAVRGAHQAGGRSSSVAGSRWGLPRGTGAVAACLPPFAAAAAVGRCFVPCCRLLAMRISVSGY